MALPAEQTVERVDDLEVCFERDRIEVPGPDGCHIRELPPGVVRVAVYGRMVTRLRRPRVHAVRVFNTWWWMVREALDREEVPRLWPTGSR